MSNCFELRNVSLAYAVNNKETFIALNDFNLSVAEGERVVLIGPSGCGKSSLLRLLSGLLPPASGEIFYKGRPLHKAEESIVLMRQNAGLLPWKKIEENIALPLLLHKTKKKDALRQAQAMMASLGIAEQWGKYPAQLSGGQQQRAALGRALLPEPQVLLLDEPFSALDAFNREAMQDLLADIWRQRRFNYLLVTHSIEEAVYLGEKIIVMSFGGRIIQTVSNHLSLADSSRSSREFYETCRLLRELLKEANA